MIAAPDHLARRGMKPSVRPRERHIDAETKAGLDIALPKLPAVPLGLRQWDIGTSRTAILLGIHLNLLYKVFCVGW